MKDKAQKMKLNRAIITNAFSKIEVNLYCLKYRNYQ